MHEIISDVIAEVKRVISKPPSRPIRLMMFDTAALCGMVQNRIKDEFDNNEIININNFYISKVWEKNADRIAEAEVKYGVDNIKFQKIIYESLEKYIVNFVEQNKPRKLLVIEDSELYSNGFDPIHFLSAYMYEHYIVLDNEIPIIWITIGQKEEYGTNEYRYYKTESTSGRQIKITQDSFSSCVFDYKSDY